MSRPYSALRNAQLTRSIAEHRSTKTDPHLDARIYGMLQMMFKLGQCAEKNMETIKWFLLPG